MRIVDWDLAERIAFGLAGDGPRWDGTEAELRAESRRAARLVARYTRLRARRGARRRADQPLPVGAGQPLLVP